ncbi:MAG: ACP S-malonyltransferase [candidate division Zixibacteria bacterium]|nr:ACP S-malonyltransferase [candidate division Zixibacteria bacterium]
MSKTVLFFPGQASQYVGMGKDLFDSSEAVRQLYKLASEEIGADIAALSFEGPAEELKRTRFTQPAILLHSLAVLTILGDRLPKFDFAAGHSLGEYAAVAVTGAMSFEDAIKAVVRRASLMEEACQNNPGTMAAMIGLNQQQIEDVCSKATKGLVIPANYNSRTQVAVSGDLPGVDEAIVLAKEAGAKRAMKLEVGGAFHSPLMESAGDALGEYLDSIVINDPATPVVANVTGEKVLSGDEIRALLKTQVTAPVKWAQTMEYLVQNGVSHIIEIGPGKVLSGLAKRDMKPESLISLDTLADIEKVVELSDG